MDEQPPEQRMHGPITVEWDASRPGRYWIVTFGAARAEDEVRVRLHSEELADLCQKALEGLLHR